MVLESLNKIKSQVESSEYLSEEELSKILADLSERITEVETAKATITALSENATDDQIKEAAQTIKKAWIGAKPDLEIAAGKLKNARLGGIIVKSTHLEAKLERILGRMAINGTDTSAVEPIVAEFKTQVESAKSNFKLAQEKFAAASKEKDVARASLIKEAQNLMDQAHKNLQEANKKLVEIVAKIKQVGAADVLEEDDTAEAAADAPIVEMVATTTTETAASEAANAS